MLPPLLPLLGYVAAGVPTLGRVALFVPRLVLWRRGPATSRAALAAGLFVLVTASTIMATRPQREDRAAAERRRSETRDDEAESDPGDDRGEGDGEERPVGSACCGGLSSSS